MPTQAETAAAFAELHRRDGTFIIPNPWDVGSAILLAHAGFEALATSSAGYAFTIGKPDGEVGREQTLAHAAEVVAATGLPVSIDLGVHQLPTRDARYARCSIGARLQPLCNC